VRLFWLKIVPTNYLLLNDNERLKIKNLINYIFKRVLKLFFKKQQIKNTVFDFSEKIEVFNL
jgi:hypothetical protein